MIFLIRWGSYIFEKSCLLSHNCVPNTRWFIHEKWTPDLKPTYTIYWKMTTPARRGEIISTNYTDLTQGSFERKLDLYEGYYFTCSCTRCLDPKEFGTLFSGIKCTDCLEGYLLPLPLPRSGVIWKCYIIGCHGSKTELEMYRVLAQLHWEMSLIDQKYTEENVLKLNDFLKRNQGVTVHSNHFLMMEAEFDLVRRLLTVIPTLTGDPMVWINRVVDLAEHCIRVFGALCPGKTLQRGNY